MADERDETAERTAPLVPPDAAPVNAAWQAEPGARGGLRGFVDWLQGRFSGPRIAAQREFNARQVRLDNEMLRYLEERFAATHRHYDGLVASLGRRQDEADERHRLLERELVAHVQDLVRRIDLILLEANREKLSLAFAIEEARARLVEIERALLSRE